MLFMLVSMVIFSTIIFFVEEEAQPDAFSSIPASFWWTVVTMTTVGYGDVVPHTPAGKCVGWGANFSRKIQNSLVRAKKVENMEMLMSTQFLLI